MKIELKIYKLLFLLTVPLFLHACGGGGGEARGGRGRACGRPRGGGRGIAAPRLPGFRAGGYSRS